MTFAELQRGVFDDLQYQAQPKPGVQDRVRRYLNEGLERVLRRPRLKNLRLGTMPLTAVLGQGFYGAPMILERIDYLIDTTNGRKLRFRTRDWYRSLDPSVLTTGVPSVWIPEGVTPVRRQPVVGGDGLSKVYARSEWADDTTQTIRIQQSYAGPGNDFAQFAILTGLAPVIIGGPLAGPTQISKLYLTSTAKGFVYVTDHTGPDYVTNPLAVIPSGELSSRYLGIRLYPTPSEAITYEIEGQRVIPRMTQDEDEPPFHDDFHEMLQCYARARFYRKDGRLQQSREEMAEFERDCLDLTAAVEFPSNYRPVAGKLSAEGTRWSDLGPNYPADRFGVIAD